jgi:hypothetical protein
VEGKLSKAIIAIPTLGRIGNQVTLNQLPESWKERTFLICPPEEHGKHGHQTISCPLNGIHKVRQWIMHNIEAKAIIQLDDDMKFRVRRGKSLVRAETADVGEAMDWLVEAVSWRGFVQAGIGDHYMSNQQPAEKMCTTVIAAHCYNVKRYRGMGLRFDRIAYHEDVDVSLQVLRSGVPNIVTHQWVRVQPDQQGEGGCSVYRDVAHWNQVTHQLKALHPEYVRHRWREIGGQEAERWGGTVKGSPMIMAKKAYKDGCEKAGVEPITEFSNG